MVEPLTSEPIVEKHAKFVDGAAKTHFLKRNVYDGSHCVIRAPTLKNIARILVGLLLVLGERIRF